MILDDPIPQRKTFEYMVTNSCSHLCQHSFTRAKSIDDKLEKFLYKINVAFKASVIVTATLFFREVNKETSTDTLKLKFILVTMKSGKSSLKKIRLCVC